MMCPECQGCGEVVIPMTMTDDNGEVHLRQVAMICGGCGGKKVIDE